MDRPMTLLHLMTGLPGRTGRTGRTGQLPDEIELPTPAGGFDLAQLLGAISESTWVVAD